ncbi:19984_t:CDS:1, partial [Gigaspora rosea]
CVYIAGGLQAPILKNLIDARLLMICKRLCMSGSTWTKYERERISDKLKEKRNIEVVWALQEANISTKAWPTE